MGNKINTTVYSQASNQSMASHRNNQASNLKEVMEARKGVVQLVQYPHPTSL
jgi:hypothetical protein